MFLGLGDDVGLMAFPGLGFRLALGLVGFRASRVYLRFGVDAYRAQGFQVGLWVLF